MCAFPLSPFLALPRCSTTDDVPVPASGRRGFLSGECQPIPWLFVCFYINKSCGFDHFEGVFVLLIWVGGEVLFAPIGPLKGGV